MIRLSIRRPVAITMVYGGVAALGAFAWRNIPIELIPDTNLPRLSVSGSWRGASPPPRFTRNAGSCSTACERRSTRTT